MVRLASLALVLAAAGCVDTSKCHAPSDWKPCAGETAEPGSSGMPPTIVQLSMPTCGYVDSPTVKGTLHVTDPDGDAQVVKSTLFMGARSNEAEVQLDDAGRNGNEWSGDLLLSIMTAAGGMAMQGTSDVRVKVTDRAGGQSVPYCNSIALVR